MSGADSALDRAAQRRRDPDWVRSCLSASNARVLLMWRSRHLMDGERGARLTMRLARTLCQGAESEPLLLGLERGRPLLVRELPPAREDAPAQCERLGRFEDLRAVAARLSSAETGVLGYARALTWWHRHHAFCPRCGGASVSVEGGAARECNVAGCGPRQFPRTDPAVITLVTYGQRCLLARQPGWPRGLYSTLAGFVEPGEDAEQAVRREVAEEVGIELGRVRYLASQSWPFPSSLMLAFRARALSPELRVDYAELEDARWFDRAALERALEVGSSAIPGPHSVAHAMILAWLRRRSWREVGAERP